MYFTVSGLYIFVHSWKLLPLNIYFKYPNHRADQMHLRTWGRIKATLVIRWGQDTFWTRWHASIYLFSITYPALGFTWWVGGGNLCRHMENMQIVGRKWINHISGDYTTVSTYHAFWHYIGAILQHTSTGTFNKVSHCTSQIFWIIIKCTNCCEHNKLPATDQSCSSCGIIYADRAKLLMSFYSAVAWKQYCITLSFVWHVLNFVLNNFIVQF